jgi:ATP-dependent exoDNAse (exonuclease V) beta subunit
MPMRARDIAMDWLPGIEWTGAAVALEPEDLGERRRALDPERSFIVQAPAGSGKTELLIQRFLALLARVAQPEAVVAITFTVKAAGEMRGRLLDALANASGRVEPASAHERFTHDLARAALEQDARQRWDLLNNPDRLRIQTIDALSMAITRQMPWMARFGAMPSVTENAREMYGVAAQRTIEVLAEPGEHAAAVAALLRHLDNDPARAAGLLARMLEFRDHWLLVVGADLGVDAVREQLESSLARIVTAHLVRLRAAVPDRLTRELIATATYAATNLSTTDKRIASCCGLTDLPGTGTDCLPLWLGLAELLLTGKGDWRKSVDRNIGFPPSNRQMKERFSALLSKLPVAEEFRALLEQVSELPSCGYEDSQWEVLCALFRLLPVGAAQLRSVFTEKGTVDFVEIGIAARRALGAANRPTDLALVLGARVEHLLVDEFQDTSVTQFELLRTLTAGWEEDRRRTVFLVGDPMQSIYRFRQAEVGLFLNVRRSGIGSLRPEPLGLTVNFRSGRPVVDWVNRVFSEAFPAAADAASGAVAYARSIAFDEGADGAGVQVHPFIGRDDGAEAELVCDLITRERRERPAGRIAVLVRSRSHLGAIADYLRDEGIPHRAIEIQALAEKPVIQDLLALTRALLHLADRVAWLAVLRAPWCGLALADLQRIAGADPYRPIWSLLHDPECALEREAAARLNRILPTLSRALSMRARIPVAELVERTWIALGGDRIAGENGRADARAYFDLLEDTGRSGDIEYFEALASRIQDLFASPDGADASVVELMTIHKAKGLEFDSVILPGLGKRPRVDEPSLLLWSERPTEDGAELLIAPIAARRNGEDHTYDYLRRENDEKNRHEAVRLLYVACTRARSRLHLIGAVDVETNVFERRLTDPPRDSLLAHIWMTVRPQFEARLNATDKASSVPSNGPRKPQVLRRVPLGASCLKWLPDGDEPPATSAPVQIGEDANDVARRIGTVTHRCLERIARDGVDRWNRDRIEAMQPALTVALAAEGVAAEQCKVAALRIVRALTATIADRNGRWMLGPHRAGQSEFALSGVIDGEVRHLVIDRTFMTEAGTRWIVDFKTSEPGPGEDVDSFIEAEKRAYEVQLRRYAEVLSGLEARTIRLGLYFVMLARWAPVE